MREAKFGDKSEKSFDIAFDSEYSAGNDALGFAGGAELSKPEADESFTGEHKTFINALKQVFLFLPGTFLLFFISFFSSQYRHFLNTRCILKTIFRGKLQCILKISQEQHCCFLNFRHIGVVL